MKINGKEVKVNVFCVSDNKYNEDFLRKYFVDEEIEFEKSEDTENKECFCILNTNIDNDNFLKFVKGLAEFNFDFEIMIDSDEAYVYEVYTYTNGDSFVVKKFVENNGKETSQEHLKKIIFDEKQETIYLKDI